jgi:hypothetical protein
VGYARYVAQGGDVGAGVTDAMARQAPTGLLGIHLNFLRNPPLEWHRGLGGADVLGERTKHPCWVEKVYPNLVYFNEVDRGGHFAAWEEPELFSQEIRAAFRPLR